MEINAIKQPPPETLARKLITTGLLVLSLFANAIPIFFIWDFGKSANVWAWILVMGSILQLLPIWVVLCGMIALLAVMLSRSRARTAIGLAIASLDGLALAAMIALFL